MKYQKKEKKNSLQHNIMYSHKQKDFNPFNQAYTLVHPNLC